MKKLDDQNKTEDISLILDVLEIDYHYRNEILFLFTGIIFIEFEEEYKFDKSLHKKKSVRINSKELMLPVPWDDSRSLFLFSLL